jgi:hypothetical protein
VVIQLSYWKLEVCFLRKFKEAENLTLNIAGVKTKFYMPTRILKMTPTRTEGQRAKAKEFLMSLGLDGAEIEANWDNLKPLLQTLKGKIVLTEMGSDEDARCKTPPTTQQVEEGLAKGLERNQIKGGVLRASQD